MHYITSLLGGKRWWLWLVIGAVGILALVGWLIGAASSPLSVVAQGEDSTLVVNTPTSIDPFALEQSLMATAEAALIDSTLSEQGRQVYENELQTLREQTTSVALARTSVAATKTVQPDISVALNATPGPISPMGAAPQRYHTSIQSTASWTNGYVHKCLARCSG